MEGKVSFIFVEPILRSYTKEKGLQALFRIHRINTKGFFRVCVHIINTWRLYTRETPLISRAVALVYIESMQRDLLFDMEPIKRGSLLCIENQYKKAKQKTKATNMEGKVSFIYIEAILKCYTQERRPPSSLSHT